MRKRSAALFIVIIAIRSAVKASSHNLKDIYNVRDPVEGEADITLLIEAEEVELKRLIRAAGHSRKRAVLNLAILSCFDSSASMDQIIRAVRSLLPEGARKLPLQRTLREHHARNAAYRTLSLKLLMAPGQLTN